MSSYPNAHAIASMHLEPAAPVYNTLPCCDSMQMSHARCHTGTRHELSPLSHLVLFPNEDVDTLAGSDASHAGTGPEDSGMRHAPSILPAASGLWTRGRKGLERAGASSNWICGPGPHQRPEGKPKRCNSFDAMRIERERSMSPPQWFACSTHVETKKVARLHTVVQ
jgi:hypothetical protein